MVKTVTPHIRWMIRRDLTAVLPIERVSFEHPWKHDDFLHALRQRNCIGMVAERTDLPAHPDGLVVWYMLYEMHRSAMRVLNFAVHPDHRRQGVGRAMAEKLAHKLEKHRRRRLVWHVNETNLDCHLFLRSLRIGIRAVRCVKNFYTHSPFDAYRFELDNPYFAETDHAD